MKPIPFNTEMVSAILDGCKTVTRRVVKGANSEWPFIGLDDDMVEVAKKRGGNRKGFARPISFV